MRPCHFFLTREGVLGISHLVVFLFHLCKLFAIIASYVMDNIGEVAFEVINDLNESLGFRHFLYVMNERASLHRERAHLKVPRWSFV